MGRRPDYNLSIKAKGSEDRLPRAGVAWENSKGWIDIHLNPGVVLHWNDEVYINLYPYEDPA